MTRAALLLLCACGVSHVAPYVPKHREYELPASEMAALKQQPGSLFIPGQGVVALFTDARAYRINDVVVVKVEEIADAQRKAETSTQRDSGFSMDISAFLKAVNGLGWTTAVPALDAKLGANSGTTFGGTGSTSRSEHLEANVPSIVKKVLPNGNLFVEGHRVVLVNNEENHFYISGVVRPIDIDQNNTIKSSLIAEAEVEFTGRGVLTDNQQKGWLSRFMSWVWPF